jgi:hypothetical protein
MNHEGLVVHPDTVSPALLPFAASEGDAVKQVRECRRQSVCLAPYPGEQKRLCGVITCELSVVKKLDFDEKSAILI